jgi:ubiquinone/menaquinone biosynthesis C-methylase UbiE
MMTTEQNATSLAQERFGRFARNYVASSAHARGEELNRLVEIAQPQLDWIALDVATGGGHTALKFAPSVKQVIATDVTPKMLEAAQAFVGEQGAPNVLFRHADAEDLPFEDGAFDLVTCRIAPHHFLNCPRFVSEGARVLKPGGLLLVQDLTVPEDEQAARHIGDFERLRDPSHHRSYTEAEWVGMFRAAGLRVEHAEQIVKRHAFVPWVERQGRPPDVMERLVTMMAQAPETVIEWMMPHDWGTPEATFANHHLIIAGRKGPSPLR